MEIASSHKPSAGAFTSEELHSLRRNVHQSANDDRFSKDIVLRLFATIDEKVRERRAEAINAKRSTSGRTIRKLQREITAKGSDNARLTSAFREIAKITTKLIGELGRQDSDEGSGIVATLPPMQRLVFDEICRGKTTRQIAEELHRSRYTIANHVKLIFKAFGVKNRSSLMMEVFVRRSAM